MILRKTITSIVSVLMVASVSAADNYPSKPITIVAPYGAGGASDIAARSLAESARKHTRNEPVIVVNKTGNGGMVGARFVNKAKPDGYTLLLARTGMSLYPAVNKSSRLDWDSYTFLGALEATPMILAVNADSPYESISDLIDAIKNKPGEMSYAASGPTAIDGFSVQAMLSDEGLNPQSSVSLIPYRGGSALASALLGGHVDFLAIAAGSLMPHIKAGTMRALAVYAPERVNSLPDVPTMTELGYEKAGKITGWSALYGPKDLPADVVGKWKTILGEVAIDPEWLDLTAKRGSISTIGKVDLNEYAKSQYMLFSKMAVEFGYLK